MAYLYPTLSSLMVLLVAIQLEHACDAQEIRVCGKKLVDLANKVCNHCLYDGSPINAEEKRGSVPGHKSTDLDEDDAKALKSLASTSKRNSYLKGLKTVMRAKRQIATECCINRCTMAQIEKYCCVEK